MKHIPKTWLKIAKIHLLVDGDEENWLEAYSQKEMTSFLYMENNILKSSNLFHSLKVYEMLLIVSGTQLDIEERKLNVMLYLPSGHSWICWLFDVLFLCSEKICEGYQQNRSKSAIEKGGKKPPLDWKFFVCLFLLLRLLYRHLGMKHEHSITEWLVGLPTTVVISKGLPGLRDFQC